MDKLSKLKRTEKIILKEFDRICRKNDIKYSLGYGTLLGAVRHKGFIPWDDDIDIMMNYNEYMKFNKIALKELKEKFYFQSRDINLYNFVFWNRIGLKNTTSIDITLSNIKADWGICIDIFPLFPLSKNKKIQKKEFKWIRSLIFLSQQYIKKDTIKVLGIKSALKKTFYIIFPKFANALLTKMLLKKFDKIDINNCDYYIECGDYPKIYRFLKEDTLKYSEMLFGGEKFMTFKNYDNILTSIYGDYMIPPPEQEQIMHSDNPNVFIDFNSPYQRYYKKK